MTGVILVPDKIRYAFGDIKWAGEDMLGWTFEIDVLASGELS